uniref:Uncharacterized protein n=1 Tax=Monopterus albus TaxID=43700 RepID=A0A3Q3IKS0_MONAL
LQYHFFVHFGLTIVVPHIEAKAEEDVVPDEHLHARFFTRVDSHDVAINYCHGASSGSCCKVTVDLQDGKTWILVI